MAGNFYISDFANHRVRKVTNAGTISTFAGNGSFGFTGNGGPAVSAGISEPNGLAVDAAGNLFIADFQDNRILKINTSGIITNFAGTGAGGYSGDGGLATNAELYGPTDIVLDAGGNMYVSDFGNNCIRKINANGIITTIAGIGTSGFSGDGGLAISAKLNGPYSLAFNSSGDLYFSDEGNNRIRKITNVVGIFENN